jgi:hypothetical protein
MKSRTAEFMDLLDGVPGGFGGVGAAGRGRPAEGPVGELVDGPARLLLEPVVMTTLRTAITQARPAARLKRNIMFEVALAGRSAADRAGAGGVPDLGQVPEFDSRVVALGLEPWSQSWVLKEWSSTIRSGPGPGIRRRQVPYPPGGPSPGSRVKLNPGPSLAAADPRVLSRFLRLA